MQGLLKISRGVDRLNGLLGRFVGWLTLVMVLVGAYNAVTRYGGRFTGTDLSSNTYIELQWYLFSLVFLLGAAYTLQRDRHVRVDVVYGRLGRRDTPHLGPQLFEGGGGADKRRAVLHAGHRAPEPLHLPDQHGVLPGPRERRHEALGIDRLLDEVVGSASHRVDRLLERSVAADQHDRGRRVDALQERVPVPAWQAQVGQDQVRRLAREDPFGGVDGLDRLDLVALLLEERDERRADEVLVLDQEDGGGVRHEASSPTPVGVFGPRSASSPAGGRRSSNAAPPSERLRATSSPPCARTMP